MYIKCRSASFYFSITEAWTRLVQVKNLKMLKKTWKVEKKIVCKISVSSHSILWWIGTGLCSLRDVIKGSEVDAVHFWETKCFYCLSNQTVQIGCVVYGCAWLFHHHWRCTACMTLSYMIWMCCEYYFSVCCFAVFSAVLFCCYKLHMFLRIVFYSIFYYLLLI